MYPKTCTGCGVAFEAKNANQRKCQRHCGRINKRDTEKAKRAAAAEIHDLEFIGVDGEGIWGPRNVPKFDDDGYPVVDSDGDPIMLRNQSYVLLSVGDQSLYHEDERELTFSEVASFLWEQFEAHPKAVFVGFSLGYDFNFWLKSLTATSAWNLFTPAGRRKRTPKPDSPRRMLYPVRDGGTYWSQEDGDYIERYVTPEWEFDFLGTKRFSMRPYVRWGEEPTRTVHHKDGTTSEQKIPRPWMHICDTFPYFQAAFMTVLNKTPADQRVWTDAEYELIKKGKDDRSDAYHITPEMIRYNTLENDILGRIMRQMNEGFVADGIKLDKSQWYGPGQAAQTWMKNVGFPTSEDVQAAVPKWALDAAHDSYYGGWFEIFAHGLVPGTSYDYDINSAYPSVIAKLPCLLHGRWSRSKTLPARVHGDRRVHLVYADIVGTNHFVGPAPHRTKAGSIMRPRYTRGWHWLHELEASQRAGLLKSMRVRKVVTYEPCACPSPGEPIAGLYEGRLKLNKNSPRGKARKYVYNSSYGKCAQSVGKPKFANPVYASLITAGCRTMILDAIATHPTKSASLLMVATDGIVFREPHPGLFIDPKEGLGNWSMKTYENLTLFMPGVYWDDEHRRQIEAGKVPGLKSRGVSARYMPELVPAIDAQFRELNAWLGENPPWPEHTLRISFAQTSAKQAITRGRWDLCAKIDEHGVRKLSGNPVAKRNSSGVKHVGDITRTFLHVHDPDAVKDETTYYPTDRMFGMTGENPGPGGGLLVPEDIDVMDTPDGPVLLEFLEGFDR
jgi:hypothetical protein